MHRFTFLRRPEFRELAILLFVIACGLLFRLFIVDARTIHIDEGMGLRASELMYQGAWKYYPANGHGPTLFFLGAFLKGTIGLNLLTGRIFMILLCMLAIGILTSSLRSRFSFPALLLLACSLCVSSAMNFYSVYFIHEMVFFLFTVIAFCLGDAWLQSRSAIYLIAFLIACVVMYATKETAILTGAAWGASLAVLLAHEKNPWKYRTWISPRSLLLGAILAIFTWVLLFSAGFRSMDSSLDAFRALIDWSNRATVMHQRPFWYFGVLLLVHEFPLVLGTFGMACALFWNDLWNRRLVAIAVWFLAIFFIYSAIPYKTPWCIPSIILPLVLLLAEGFDVLWKKHRHLHRMFAFFVAFLLGMQCVITVNDTFIHPDRETSFDYAYLQSDESLRMMDRIIHDLSSLRGGTDMPMQILGSSDELLFILTEPYRRTFEPFTPGLPVYINYQHPVEDARASLSTSSVPYVRLLFTYIQHVNIVDVFVEKPLWNQYLSLHPEYETKKNGNGEYDFR